MKKLSVKLKVTIWYTFIMLIVSSVVLFAMTSFSKDYIERDMMRRLEESVDKVRPMFIEHEGLNRRMPPFLFYERGVHMAHYSADGELVAGQIPFELPDDIEFERGTPRAVAHEDNHYFVYDKYVESPAKTAGWIRGVVSMTEENYAIDSTFRNNLILTVVLLLIAAVGGYLIISRAFVPVNKIRKTALAISESSDLTQRIRIGAGKDEICQLANTFDEMLDKIEQTFEREKQFTSDASHELRTPVAVILSECEYMRDCAKTEDEFKESAETVARQADKMSRLINELLMMSRMDKDVLKLQPEETDVSELASLVCVEQAELNAERGIALVQKIAPEINANIDRFLITRALTNLVSNAYHYSESGNEITVALDAQGNEIIFTVADTGIGIEKEHLSKIWERFYQVDPARTSKESGSMGLGLSMVKWIAERHGGSVSVESTPGEGSVFVFKISAK